MATVQGAFPQFAANSKNLAAGKTVRGKSRWWVAGSIALFCVLAGIAWRAPLWVFDRFTQTRLAVAGMRSEYLTLDGHRIHYLVGGQGEPVLLVHGLGSRATDWADLIPALLHGGHRVYAIDLLGYGASDRPQNAQFSIQEESKIVEDFLVAQDLRHVDLAGWSMGGWISMVVATDLPDRVSKLVLLDSAGLRFQPSFDPLLFTPNSVQQLNQLVTLLTPEAHVMPSFIAKAFLERSESDAWVVRRAVNSMLTGQNVLDGKLGQLKMPVLIIWGKQDNLTPLSMAYQMHAGMPQSTLALYDGCGHLAPGLCASRIAPRMVSFLDSAGSPQQATLEDSEASTGFIPQLVGYFRAKTVKTKK